MAICAPDGKVAVPHATFQRANGQAEKELLELISVKGITKVIAGLPLSEDGSRNEQCEKIERFCRRLSRRAPIEVVFVDELLSTAEAKQRLGLAGGAERIAREKGVIDAVSASILLQTFLDGDQLGG